MGSSAFFYLFLLGVAVQGGYGFVNPVVNSTKPGYGLSAFEYNGTYYLLSTFYLNVYVRSSTDLQTWSDPKSILNLYDGPSWISTPSIADMVIVNGTFLLYFGTNGYCLGVASSQNLFGPYEFRQTPLVCGTDVAADGLINYPSVYNDGGKLFLYYFKYTARVHTVGGRVLSDDGLSLLNDEEIEVIQADQGNIIYGQRVFKKENDYYMIFTNVQCSGLYVAKADSPLGAYTKKPTAITSVDSKFGNLHFPVVVRAKDGSDVLLYASDNGEYRCTNDKTYVVAQNMLWQGDEWPSLDER